MAQTPEPTAAAQQDGVATEPTAGAGSWSTAPQAPAPSGKPASTGPKKLSPLAASSAAVGFFLSRLPVIGGVVAVGLGITAILQIRKAPNELRGTWLAVVGIVLGLFSAALWTVALISPGSVPEAYRDSVSNGENSLDAGLCFDFDPVNSNDFTVSSFDAVPCDGPHSAEVAGTVRVSGDRGVPFPGDDVVLDQSGELCVQAFASHIGRTFADSPELDLFISYPQPETWDEGDRNSVCFVTTVDGSLLTAPLAS